MITLCSRIGVNTNSWYIAMHLDRLNQELLDEYRKQDRITKKEKSKIKHRN